MKGEHTRWITPGFFNQGTPDLAFLASAAKRFSFSAFSTKQLRRSFSPITPVMQCSPKRPNPASKGQPFCASTWLPIYCNVKLFSPCSSLDSSPLQYLALPLKMPIYPRLNAISSAITLHLLQKSSSLSLLFPLSLSLSVFPLPLMFPSLFLFFHHSSSPLSLSLHSPSLYPLSVSLSLSLRATTSLYSSISLPTPSFSPLPSLSSAGLGIAFSSAV